MVASLLLILFSIWFTLYFLYTVLLRVYSSAMPMLFLSGFFITGDGIDEGVPEAGSPPKKFLNFAALEDNEFFSDDEPNSDGSHSPEVDPDEDVKLDLPDIIISGMRRTRTRTMSESEVLRVKNLEYRIACRLAQIGDEFDLQMFQDMVRK